MPHGVGKTVFFGGPIQHAFSAVVCDKPLKSIILSLINRLKRDGYSVLSAHLEEKFGQVDMSGQPLYVTDRDHRWMLACDIYVCVIPAGRDGRPYRTDGTCIELGWASAYQKKVVVLWDSSLEYSHLIIGLGAVADVTQLDLRDVLDNPDLFASALRSKPASWKNDHSIKSIHSVGE